MPLAACRLRSDGITQAEAAFLARVRARAVGPGRASGLQHREAAGIPAGTVRNHRRRLYEKIGISTERELFLQFFQHRMNG